MASIKNRLNGFLFFYNYLGVKILYGIFLSILAGILDGFGITMFLPLFQLVDESAQVNPEELGGLKFLLTGIEYLGISLNLLNILLFMVVFFLLKGVVSFFQFYYRVILQQQFIRRLRLETVSGINEINYKYFLKSDSGRIQNTLTGEVERLSKSYQSYFSIIQNAVLVTVYMIFAFFVNYQFALLVCIGGLLTNLIYKSIYSKTKFTSRELTKKAHLLQGLVLQYIHYFKYLKATSRLKKFSKKLENSINKIEEDNRYAGFLMSILNASREPLIIIVVALIIYFQTIYIGSPLGPVLVSLLFFYRALSYLMQLQGQYNLYLTVAGSMENIEDVKKELRSNKEKTGKVNLTNFKNQLEIVSGGLSIDNHKILTDINLKIKKNQTVAFVGESGSGKTSLVNIICGLMPLDEGNCLIDNENFKDINRSSWQKRIGYITQDPVIFNDTIFNNVTFWANKSEKNINRFNNALKKAAAFEFVNNLNLKEDTFLGHNGLNLSGGQKQRISIARELYKDIDILVLDEATSALDSETELEIQQNIEQLKGEYTLIIVAHRLSSIKYADTIVLLSNGQIKSMGSFERLYDTSSQFKRMAQLQDLHKS